MHRHAFIGTVIAVAAVTTLTPAGAAPKAPPTPASVSAWAFGVAGNRTAPIRAAKAPAGKAQAAKPPAAKAHAANHLAVTISSNCAGFCFVPATMTISVGDAVTWVNRTGIQHNVTRCSRAACDGVSGGTGTDASFTAGNVGSANGATFSHTFSAPGTYVYFCTIHGYAAMHGTITVTAAAPTTTVAVPPTTVAAPVAAPAPGPTTPPGPQLASTGATTGTPTVLAVLLVVAGLAAAGFPRRTRRTARGQ